VRTHRRWWLDEKLALLLGLLPRGRLTGGRMRLSPQKCEEHGPEAAGRRGVCRSQDLRLRWSRR